MTSVGKRADTGRWQARHRGPDGKERAKDLDRKMDADRWLHEQAAKVDGGQWTDPQRARVTVGEYAQEWLRGKVKLKVVAQHRPAGAIAAALKAGPELFEWAEQVAERHGTSLADLLAAKSAAGKGA